MDVKRCPKCGNKYDADVFKHECPPKKKPVVEAKKVAGKK